jgi:cytochrome c-type biogenesis protein CcmE
MNAPPDAPASVAPADAVPPKPRGAWKVVASVVVIGGAILVLGFASVKQGAEYYKHVNEVMSNIDSFRGKRLQVHGFVVDKSIEQAKGTLLYRFKIESRPPDAHAVIEASYSGLVPDTFKSGAEVVAKGTLTADNKLDVIPDGIMAKCPSKYDADKARAAGSASAAPAAAPGVAQKL